VESTSADCIEGNERSDVTEDQSSGQNGNLSQGGVEDVRMDDVEVVPVDDEAGDQAHPLAVGQASSSVKKATEQEGRTSKRRLSSLLNEVVALPTIAEEDENVEHHGRQQEQSSANNDPSQHQTSSASEGSYGAHNFLSGILKARCQRLGLVYPDKDAQELARASSSAVALGRHADTIVVASQTVGTQSRAAEDEATKEAKSHGDISPGSGEMRGSVPIDQGDDSIDLFSEDSLRHKPRQTSHDRDSVSKKASSADDVQQLELLGGLHGNFGAQEAESNEPPATSYNVSSGSVFEEGLNRSGTRDLLGRVQEELAYGQKLETHQVHRNENPAAAGVQENMTDQDTALNIGDHAAPIIQYPQLEALASNLEKSASFNEHIGTRIRLASGQDAQMEDSEYTNRPTLPGPRANDVKEQGDLTANVVDKIQQQEAKSALRRLVDYDMTDTSSDEDSQDDASPVNSSLDLLQDDEELHVTSTATVRISSAKSDATAEADYMSDFGSDGESDSKPGAKRARKRHANETTSAPVCEVAALPVPAVPEVQGISQPNEANSPGHDKIEAEFQVPAAIAATPPKHQRILELAGMQPATCSSRALVDLAPCMTLSPKQLSKEYKLSHARRCSFGSLRGSTADPRTCLVCTGSLSRPPKTHGDPEGLRDMQDRRGREQWAQPFSCNHVFHYPCLWMWLYSEQQLLNEKVAARKVAGTTPPRAGKATKDPAAFCPQCKILKNNSSGRFC
jgi:hypothetical protein